MATAALITPVDTAAEHAHTALIVHRTASDGARGNETGVVSNLIRAGQLDVAEEIAEEVLESARENGLIQRHAMMLSMRGWIRSTVEAWRRRATTSRPRSTSARMSHCPRR